MIEKMKFISITGPKEDFDRVINTYLTKYDIHLENALTELSTSHNLRPFIENNPYKELAAKSEDLVKKLEGPDPGNQELMSPQQAADIINAAYNTLSDLNDKKKVLKAQQHECNELLTQIEHFRHLDYDIHKIMDLKFIKFRFGKIPHEFYTRFSKYVYENLTTVFYECERDREYVWGIYFVPANEAVKIDAIYTSLHFERVKLPDAYEGTPEESYHSIVTKISDLGKELDDIYKEIKARLNDVASDLKRAHYTVDLLSRNFDVRKLAACTREKGKKDVFYIICGWITEKDCAALLAETEKDDLVYCLTDDGQADKDMKPPTKLKNLKLFKPFEMFIKMYGLPAYNEIDPTSFVAITYSIIFGIMFGDVGQGLCLVVGGLLIYKFKKMSLAAIISLAGVFSTIFGFLYGSVFGFEELLHPVWMSPRENVMSMLYTAIGFGVFLIVLAMLINIINGIKAKDWGRVLFDTNGVAGLVFYGMLITCVVLVFTGRPLPAVIFFAIFFVLPLVIIFFREPLTHLVEKKAHIFPEHKVMFFVEAIFEMFEVLLSYLTNTISFLRVGAFALSHAAMMGVVMLLAGAETSNPNIAVLVLGNVIVALMEGLVVGIQVLRLEYYEMFSRFYKGTGKEFKPYKSRK
ncbi:V/A-type H+-transporting ATPase subunit I [Anaerotaenia torta]|uniref:V-type ATP synthase subunit I n=1 Tax=Anaerotaenia torta TaxID=433293 RepID=UPI003D1C425A